MFEFSTLMFPLVFFLGTYFLCLWSLMTLVLLHPTANLAYLHELSAGLAAASASWVLVIVVLAFAGLPPFILFFAKLGLLSWMMGQGTWSVLILFLGLIFFGWYLYSAVAIRLLLHSWTYPQLEVMGGQSVLFAVLLLLMVFLIFGGSMLVDCYVGLLLLS